MSSEPNRRWVLDALDQFESRLLRYAQRLLGDGCGSAGDESRDVVQFVFLRLCDQSPEVIGDRLAQWLYIVCRNKALDVLRASGRVGWAVPTTGHEDGGHSPPYSRECDPAEVVEQSDLHALLRRLIEELPRSQREVIDLWSDGFSYGQISEITSQTEGHIRVLVHRGLKAIREHPQVRLIVEEEEELEGPRQAREKVCGH